jgi:hypothetical protein
LREGERQRSVTRHRNDERHRRTTRLTRPLLSQPLGETCDCRSVKYRSQRWFNAKERAQT